MPRQTGQNRARQALTAFHLEIFVLAHFGLQRLGRNVIGSTECSLSNDKWSQSESTSRLGIALRVID